LAQWLLADPDYTEFKPKRADIYFLSDKTRTISSDFQGRKVKSYLTQPCWMNLWNKEGDFLQLPYSKICAKLAAHSAETDDDFKYLVVEKKKPKRVLDKEVIINRLTLELKEKTFPLPEGGTGSFYSIGLDAPDAENPFCLSLVEKYEEKIKPIERPADRLPEASKEV
jgi:hypothetical protein